MSFIIKVPDQSGNNGKYLKTNGTTVSWDTPAGGGGGVSDGDKGDVTVSGGGTVWTIDNGVVTVAKINATGTPGSNNYLRGDGTWSTVAVLAKSFEQNLGSAPKWRGKFTVSDGDISASSIIDIQQRFAALTGKGTIADENEMDRLIVNAEAGSGSMTVYWEVQPQYIVRKKRVNGNSVRTSASALSPYQDAFLYETIRIGKVKGNFKFSYTIH